MPKVKLLYELHTSSIFFSGRMAMTISASRTLVFLVPLLMGIFGNIFLTTSIAKTTTNSPEITIRGWGDLNRFYGFTGENLLKFLLVSSRLTSDVRFSTINSDLKFGMVKSNPMQ